MNRTTTLFQLTALLYLTAATGCSVHQFNKPLYDFATGPAGSRSGNSILCALLNSPFYFHSMTVRREKTGEIYSPSQTVRIARNRYLFLFTRIPTGTYSLGDTVSINALHAKRCFFFRAADAEKRVTFTVKADRINFLGDLLFLRRKNLHKLKTRYPHIRSVKLQQPHRFSRETGATLYLTDLCNYNATGNSRTAARRLTLQLLPSLRSELLKLHPALRTDTARLQQTPPAKTVTLQQALLYRMPVKDPAVTNPAPFTVASLAARHRYKPNRLVVRTASSGSSENLFDGLFDGLFSDDDDSSGGSKYSITATSHN